MSEKTKPRTTVQIKTETFERYKRLGKMGESWDSLLSRLLNEEPYINDLKEALKTSNEKSEKSRKEGKRALMQQAYDALHSACKKFIADVESR